MRNSGLAAVFLSLALPAAAAPGDGSSNRWVSPRLDGDPVTLVDPATGRTWTAWAYGRSGEFDLALSTLDASGRWSAPVFLGAGDDVDQIEPALAVDAAGVFYVAYAERGTGRVQVAALAPAAASWRPVATIDAGTANVATPALKVIGDRLVVAFRVDRDVRIHVLPLVPTTTTSGIDDGPDPFGNGRGNGGGNGNGSRTWKPR